MISLSWKCPGDVASVWKIWKERWQLRSRPRDSLVIMRKLFTPFNIMTWRIVLFRTGLEMFSFSIMESSFTFSNVKINWTTRYNIKWDNFDILASGKTDYHCKIKETLFIHELKPALNVKVGRKIFCFISKAFDRQFQFETSFIISV